MATLKTWDSTIRLSIYDMGMECYTQQEYIELLKQSFYEEFNIKLEDHEITDINFEEVSDG
jgi:lipoate-protein ligase A